METRAVAISVCNPALKTVLERAGSPMRGMVMWGYGHVHYYTEVRQKLLPESRASFSINLGITK